MTISMIYRKPRTSRYMALSLLLPQISRKRLAIYFAIKRANWASARHIYGERAKLKISSFSKNDHLLFAYCGFSLQVRKRSLKTELRALLATKKRAHKIFEPGGSVLIRDASEKHYPYLDKDETLPREQRGYWKIFQRGECKHDGVHLYWRRKFAFFDKDNVHWDLSDNMNDALPHQMMDPWSDEETSEKIRSARQAAMDIWNGFSDEERAWYEAHLVLPYENILAFDEDGDDIYNGAHVFTPQWMFQPPHRCAYTHQLYTSSQQHQIRYCRLDDRNRVKWFARAREEG